MTTKRRSILPANHYTNVWQAVDIVIISWDFLRPETYFKDSFSLKGLRKAAWTKQTLEAYSLERGRKQLQFFFFSRLEFIFKV